MTDNDVYSIVTNIIFIKAYYFVIHFPKIFLSLTIFREDFKQYKSWRMVNVRKKDIPQLNKFQGLTNFKIFILLTQYFVYGGLQG